MNNIKPSIEKAKTALNAIDGIEALVDKDRQYILSLVNDIRAYQAKIGKVQDKHNAQEYCSDCEGTCCFITVEDSIGEIDYFVMLFNTTGEYRKMTMDTLDDYTFPDCHFKKEEGCIIPENARPLVCKSFFCGRMEKLSDILEKTWKPALLEKTMYLKETIKEMGFNLGGNGQMM